MEKYNKENIEDDLWDSHQSFINHLMKKYGPVPYDYFVDKSCSSRNAKNSRSSEGLVIHHKDENKASMLSDQKYALKAPFKYQKAERLVYCNLLEHLILHLKIFKNNPALGLGGMINYMIPTINDYYNGWRPKQGNLDKIYSVLDDNLDGYISILIELGQEAFNYPWLDKRVNKEKMSKGSDGKIVQIVYDKLKDSMIL